MASETILVVDDDPVIRKIVSKIVTDAGMIALSATNGTEALEKAKIEKIDAIMLDINMPGIDGVDVLVTLQIDADTNQIPVMIMTGNSDIKEVIQTLRMGARDHILKPFAPEILTRRLKIMMAKATTTA